MINSIIKTCGYICLTIHGNSMFPVFYEKQKVIVEKYDQIKIGDIIAYCLEEKNKTRIIIHRVVFVRKSYVLTKGDNNNFIDPIKVEKEAIIGKVIN